MTRARAGTRGATDEEGAPMTMPQDDERDEVAGIPVPGTAEGPQDDDVDVPGDGAADAVTPGKGE